MNKTSDFIFIITHLKKEEEKEVVIDVFCNMVPLPPSRESRHVPLKQIRWDWHLPDSNPQTLPVPVVNYRAAVCNDRLSRRGQPSFERLRNKYIINQHMGISFTKI